jgi:hypothetical protein
MGEWVVALVRACGNGQIFGDPNTVGELDWSRNSLESLVEPWGNVGNGVLEEGQELQEDPDDDDPLWIEDDEPQSPDAIDSEGEEQLAVELGEASPPPDAPVEIVIQALAGDAAADVEAARQYANRLRVLDQMHELAQHSELPQLGWHVEHEKKKLNKLHHVGSADQQASAVLRRFLKARHRDEFQRMEEARAETRKRKQESNEVRDAVRKAKLEKDAHKKVQDDAEAVLQKAMLELPTTFTDGNCGQEHKDGGTKAHIRMRVQCLDRLRIRAPDLPLELSVGWEDFRSCYAVTIGQREKARVGAVFLNVIKKIMKDLGDHLKPESDKPKHSSSKASASAPKGDPDALVKFIRHECKSVNKASNLLVV